jgi:phage gp36-like protein
MYATRDDMVKRYSLAEVSQLERYLTGSESVDAAIADAGSIIDGWIGAKYAVPLEYPPDNIKIFVCDIARYLLWKSKASEEVRRRYDDAMSYLKGVSKGTNVLLVKNQLNHEVKCAKWLVYGRSAGHRRNPDIIAPAKYVVAFWDGESRGTLGGIEYAKKNKKRLMVIKYLKHAPNLKKRKVVK